jgi:hypothetical protein
MSFLHRVRLAFEGTFQADVSTVNNDVRHFDNATFQPSYQEFQARGNGPENGWWNPTGSGAFRLLGCRVVGVGYADGTFTSDPAADPVIGMLVGGSSDRTSGKLVDIDPQWQLASAIWGLDVRLSNGDSPDWFGGRYQPNAFRDLWFGRNVTQGGDAGASATFQSVLENVVWGPDGEAKSRAIRELKAATVEGRLSIRLATFGYQDDVRQPGFTVGTAIGAIGPYLPGEPASFVRGRRFTPASGFNTWAGMTWFAGSLDEAARTLLLDLSNAFQIQDSAGTPVNVGKIFLGVLKDAAVRENTPVTAETFEPFGEIPYLDPRWLQATGGVYAVALSDAQAALARNAPLALVVRAEFNPGAMGSGPDVVGIRESDDGLAVCAEPAVLRIDGAGSADVAIYVSRYGVPLRGATVQIAQTGPSPGQGIGSPTAPDQPAAPIPVIGVPVDKVELPRTVTTDGAGTAMLTIRTQAPGNPRGYIDGQIYLIDYRLPGQSNQARPGFDYIVLHLRDAFTVPADPTWNDVKPILTQYGNLYPIMSKRLVNLGNPVDVKAHAKILHLAFTRDINDPNYMPVTRDLSEAKRMTIVKWLEKVLATGDPHLDAAAAECAATAPGAAAPPGPAAAEAPAGSKSRFARNLSMSNTKRSQP